MCIVTFGPFRFDTRSLELWKDGRKVALRPQPGRVLVMLVEQAGRLVTREELRAALWQEDARVRFDLGLNSCLKQLRRALGESGGAPQYIETLTGRGYRFTGESSILDETRTPPPGALVLMPLTPIDRTPEAAEMAVGLTEDVAVHLARAAVPVVAASSATDRTGALSLASLRASGAQYLMEGRTRASEGRLRVTAKLVATLDFTHVWAGSFDTPLDHLLDAQDRIARRLADDVSAALRQPPLSARFDFEFPHTSSRRR